MVILMQRPGLKRSVKSVWASDADLDEEVQRHHSHTRDAKGWSLVALSLAALGVVYGDIGTSPLYTFASIFPEGAPPGDENIVLGSFSMIFWTLTLLALVKYIGFVLCIDNNGQGGTVALYSVICRAAGVKDGSSSAVADTGISRAAGRGPGQGPRWALNRRLRDAIQQKKGLQTALLGVMLVAIGMVLSDGVLTPAISVVSAMEGLQFNTGISTGAVIGISIGIIVLLFVSQQFGTERVSQVFSPIMVLWFCSNAAIGVYNIAKHDASVFRGLSPSFIYYYWSGFGGYRAFRTMGSVLLCATGCEATYADLGHYGRRAILTGFVGLVYPSLMLTYLGQAAVIIGSPEKAATAYWSSVPKPVYWPVVVIATCAAVIASQALISGAFSIITQAVSLNCFPRVTIRHTSHKVHGQVFIPQICWALMILCILVVLIFKHSVKIGNAYGLTVVIVMLLDTFMSSVVMLVHYGWHIAFVLCFFLPFTFVEGTYLASMVFKIPKGAWFSLALASIITAITATWTWGQRLKIRHIRSQVVKIKDMFEELPPAPGGAGVAAAASDAGGAPAAEEPPSADAVDAGEAAEAAETAAPPPASAPAASEGPAPAKEQLRLASSKQLVARVPGIGIYYSEHHDGVPPVLTRFLRKFPALHEVVVFLTIRHTPIPVVPRSERLLVRRLSVRGFYHVVARFGYMDALDQGPEFVDMVLEEIGEYLGITLNDDLISDWGTTTAAGSTVDLEAGTDLKDPDPSVDRYRRMVQLASRMGTAYDSEQTVQSTIHTTIRSVDTKRPSLRRFSMGPALNVIQTVGPESAPDGDAAGPWVQQPSVYRRVTSTIRELAPGKRLGTLTVPLQPVQSSRPSILRRSAFGSLAAGGALQSMFDDAAFTEIPVAPEIDQQSWELNADVAEERAMLAAARAAGHIYLFGISQVKCANRKNWFRVFMLEGLYSALVNNTPATTSVYKIPEAEKLAMGVVYEL